MDWVATILTSDNAVKVMVGLVVLILLIAFLVKKEMISFNGKGLKVGHDEMIAERERNIIRNQIETATAFCNAFESKLPKVDGSNPYISKYIIEKCLDEILKWISINHLRNDECYVSIKQDALWNIVVSLSIRDEFRSDEMKELVYNGTKDLIRALVEVRKVYEKD